MSLAIEQHGGGDVEGGTSLILALSSSPTDGNLLIAFVQVSTSGSVRTATPPSGWSTLLGPVDHSNVRGYIFYKSSAASEGSSFTFTISGSEYHSGIIYEVSGHDTSGPFDGSDLSSEAASASITTQPLTPTVLNCLAITALFVNGNQTISSIDSGWTEDEHQIAGSYHGSMSASKDALTSDTTTAITNTFNLSSTSNQAVAAIVLINPATAGTTYQGTAVDGISMGESLASVATLQASAVDGLSLGETPANLATMPVSIADGVTLSESTASNVTLHLTAADGFSFGDSPAVVAALQALATDGMTLSESLAVAGSLVAIASDGVTLSDTAGYDSFIEAIAADGFTMGESTQAQLTMLAAAIDGLEMSDTGSVIANFSVTCADGVAFGETLAGIMTFAAVCADTFKLGDVAVHYQAGGLVSVGFSASKSTITFTVAKPGIGFSAKKPTITFQ